MSLDRIQLTGKDVFDKDFKSTMRGYNPKDVDEFLDIIIQDYDAFTQEINRLQQENDKLKRNTSEQQQYTRTRAPQQNTQVNYDVLKRLSNLEKAVFGKKLVNADED